jgi:hypothetical protein
MVVEVNDGDIKFIHASVGGGVIISSIKESITVKKYLKLIEFVVLFRYIKKIFL